MITRLVACVEDDEIDRRALSRALESLEDVEIVTFTSGKAAIDALLQESGDEVPQIILLDLNLPDIRGDEVLRRLRGATQHRTTPIIVVSGSKDPAAVRGVYEDGANAYLAKPRHFNELIEDYRLCLSFWLRCVRSVPNLRS